MGCRIAACRPAVISRHSGLPVATADALYFAHPYGFGEPDPEAPFALRRMDPVSGRTTTVANLGGDRDAYPTGLAASGTAIAWTHKDGNRAAITILDASTGDPIAVVASRPRGNFGYPVATDRFVAWAESSGTSPDQVGGYLYDLADGSLYRLGNQSGLYAIYANGDTVTWQESTMSGGPADTVVARLR